jgi:hypothetical protein
MPFKGLILCKNQKKGASQISKQSKFGFFSSFLVQKSHFSIRGCQGDQCKIFCPYNLSSTYLLRYLQRVRDFKVAILQKGSIEYFPNVFFLTSLTPWSSPYPWLLRWSSKILLRLGWGVCSHHKLIVKAHQCFFKCI